MIICKLSRPRNQRLLVIGSKTIALSLKIWLQLMRSAPVSAWIPAADTRAHLLGVEHRLQVALRGALSR